MDEIRAVTGFAVACAQTVLPIYEQADPDDPRPREAIEAAQAFAEGAARTKRLRDCAWAAHEAARDSHDAMNASASSAARAAAHTCGAAFLHPLAKATQVMHILGSAAHATRAFELTGQEDFVSMPSLAGPVVVDVLRRYPPAPAGSTRVTKLVRQFDDALR
nr:Imm5 family immunity protein [Kineosporia babensis]